jgi:asparagine synthase (glutamine-hydrolysing)
LSGGLDSSAIVGLLADSGASSIRTYSLGFAGAGEEEHNELPLARTVARLWGTDHHEIVLKPEDLLKDLLKMVWYLDEPYGGGLPSWYVFEFMSRDVKVALTGSGSDELFGDYGRFREYELAVSGARSPLVSMARQLEAVLPRAAAALTRPYGFSQEYFSRDYVDRYYYCSDREKRDGIFSSAEARPDTAALLGAFATGDTARDSVTSASFSTQLPEEFLLMTDRFSMAHSLEARVPYLDREFVSLMSRIPARIRTRSGDLKYLLKKAVGAFLPEEVLRGRKRGFVIPTSAWLRGALRPLVEALLRPKRIRDQGIFRPDVLERVARPHLEGRVDRGPQVWAMLMFQLWHVVYVEQRCIDAPTGSWKDLC